MTGSTPGPSGTGASAGPGRPRDPRTDDAILDAVRELLREQGYNRLSIEGVARRAGVSRPTIYRRWPTKAHLVHEAVYPAQDVHFTAPDDDSADSTESAGSAAGRDFTDDIERFVDAALVSFQRPETASAVPGLLADYRDQPELKEALNTRMDAVRAAFRDLVAAAVDRGQARPDVDADLLYDTLSAVVLYSTLSSSRRVGPGFARSVAELVVGGAGRPAAS